MKMFTTHEIPYYMRLIPVLIEKKMLTISGKKNNFSYYSFTDIKFQCDIVKEIMETCRADANNYEKNRKIEKKPAQKSIKEMLNGSKEERNAVLQSEIAKFPTFEATPKEKTANENIVDNFFILKELIKKEVDDDVIKLIISKLK